MSLHTAQMLPDFSISTKRKRRETKFNKLNANKIPVVSLDLFLSTSLFSVWQLLMFFHLICEEPSRLVSRIFVHWGRAWGVGVGELGALRYGVSSGVSYNRVCITVYTTHNDTSFVSFSIPVLPKEIM